MRNLRRLLPVVMGGRIVDLYTKNLPGALSTFQAAATAGDKRLLLYVAGNSIGVGYNATGVTDAGGANSWVSLLTAALQTTYGSTAELVFANSGDFAETGTWVNSDNPNTWNGAWCAGVPRMSSTAGSTKTIVKTCTQFDLYYFDHPAGAFTVTIDGGAPVTITTGAGAAACQTFGGLSAAEHTLVITVPVGKYAWINGIDCHSNSGISTFNASAGAATVASRPITFSPFSGVGAIPAAVSKLFIVSFTTNDYGGQTALATYRASMITLVDYFKTKGDVLLVAENRQATLRTIPQLEYERVCQSLAVGNVGYLSIAKKWGTAAEGIAAGYVTEASGVHPNDAGHVDYKDAIIAVTGL